MLSEIKKSLRQYACAKQAKTTQGFFKTGPGEYGEGDIFIGVRVPQARSVAQQYAHAPLQSILTLLKSPIHEERLVAVLILVERYQRDPQSTYRFYWKHAKKINNWDLVDLSADKIVGAYLLDRDKKPLYQYVRSPNLWERRIAIVATYAFIRAGKFSHTFKLAKALCQDNEDLMHKATGWMLREVGKRDEAALLDFLDRHTLQLPRTTLRYALERLSRQQRQHYMTLT